MGATKTFDAAVFIFTAKEAVQAMIDAHDRGVRVRLITDNSKEDVHGGRHISDLKAAGILVRTDTSHYNMHHKFVVIDGTTIMTGSFNWTKAGKDENEEDCMVLRNY